MIETGSPKTESGERTVALDAPPSRCSGAATLALALAGDVHLKVVSEMLGDSTIAITADTCTSVLPEVAREAAEAAARMVPRAPRNIPGPIRR